MFDDIPEDMKVKSTTPTVHHLFNISEDTINLSQTNTDIFHNFLAQLIYLSKRTRPDIQISISFLRTRTIGPCTYEYNNLERGMEYIQRIIGLPLILSINKSGNIKWYFDAAFVVHKDTRIHTGGFMNRVTGGSYSQSRKQKLNTKSSTEAGIVGVDYVLTQAIWTRYFLK